MMKVLVVFGTTEGQTRKIAEHIAKRVGEHGPNAQLFDCTSLPAEMDIDTYDAVVVAGSVHQHRHQTSVVHFVRKHLEGLQAKPTAFISVSLASVIEGDQKEARDYVDQFLAETGWRPTETFLVAGALLYTQYDFFKRQIMKLIVWRGGGPTDAGRDYEFTDWDALSEFVDSFVEMISP
ncbi:MAG: protoporphyrinogen oxidase [Hyphomicrobiales bacterium]|nr:protoporphyrinogen oxidase [Hyphomicrobiales bacterium]